MTEKEVFQSTITWFENNYPDLLRKYFLEINPEKQRTIARELLKFRIQKQPGWKYAIPVSLMKKLGIKIYEGYLPDGTEQRLMNAIRGELVGVMK